MKKIICAFICMLLIVTFIAIVQNSKDSSASAELPTFGKVTIYVDTSAIDARNDLSTAEKTALKDRIINHIRANFEDAVGAANVEITNDPTKKAGAGRIVKIEPGKDPDRSNPGWGEWPTGSKTAKVFLGEFMDDSSVNGSFKNPDDSWNTTKLGNAIGHTGGHEVGHSYSIGHNDETATSGPGGTDNRSKMTTGGNINSSTRAEAEYKFDKHSKDVIAKNWDKPPCVSTPDYDKKVLISYFYGAPELENKPDEGSTVDALIYAEIETFGMYELGFLGEDTDSGVADGNSNFDFIYKTSLLGDDTDAEIISFLQGNHKHTTWVLRNSSDISKWYIVNPANVELGNTVAHDDKIIARQVTMNWPDQGVSVTFNSLAYGGLSNPYNGFTYELLPFVPSNPSPANESKDVDVNTDLSWTGGDSGGNVTYDVYFEANDTTPDIKVSSAQTGSSYDPGTLENNTEYYWKIYANSEHGETEGPLWHFTTQEPSYPPYPPYITGPTTGDAGTVYDFIFNTTDPNGDDVYYYVDWGDEIVTTWLGPYDSGENITINHSWTDAGTYTIKAIARDANGAASNWSELFNISITGEANHRPTKPEVTGKTIGHVNIDYIYTAKSTDQDGDKIKYIFDWGDGSNTTASSFLINGSTFTTTHNWDAAGRFIIKVKAYDNHSYSIITEYVVLIDAIYIDDLGYLLDNNGDGEYDEFYSNETGQKTTAAQQDDGSYLIDSDGKTGWDYSYNPATGAISVLEEDEDETIEEVREFPTELILVITMAIITIAVIVYLYKKDYF